MKELSKGQVLVSISSSNSDKFMALSNKYITNINSILKNIKSDIMANVIHSNSEELTITTNKVVFSLDLNTIKKYIKNVEAIDSNNIIVLRLLQSKLYLKIISILYLIKDLNIPIISDIVEKVLQSTHIFNDIILALKPYYIIKISSKLNNDHYLD